MKKAIGLALLAGAATVGTVGVASAEGTVSGNVALTSNYVWRGLSQSDGDTAIQGGFDYVGDVFYAGTWASSVGASSGSTGSAELDLYAGVTPSLGPVNFDLGVIGYFYPGANNDIDWAELYLGASFNPIEALTLGAQVALSDDAFNAGEESTYLEANAAWAITDSFSVSGAYGNFDLGFDDYDSYNIGATLSYAGFGFDLRYFDADDDSTAVPADYDEEVAFTISRAL